MQNAFEEAVAIARSQPNNGHYIVQYALGDKISEQVVETISENIQSSAPQPGDLTSHGAVDKVVKSGDRYIAYTWIR